MKISKKLIALALLAGLGSSLVGCAGTETPAAISSEIQDKQAGKRGSRICLTNSTNVPISARLSTYRAMEWSDYYPAAVGEPGPLKKDSEICFAGWRSTRTMYYGHIEGEPGYRSLGVDVAIFLDVDGNYSSFSIFANNPYIDSSSMRLATYSSEEELPGTDWAEIVLPPGYSRKFEYGGRTFTMFRRADSEYYVEYLIHFSK